jgi:hypothetical protein
LIADLRGPDAVGEKVTLTWQLALGAKVLGEMGQLLFWLKSLLLAPPTAMEVRVRLAVPLLLTVTVCAALAVLRSCLPELRLLGENVIGGVPVPLSATVCGLPEALSVKESEALREPAAKGPKITLTAQVALGTSVAPAQVSALSAKSPALVPPIPTVEMLRLAVPMLVRVTV